MIVDEQMWHIDDDSELTECLDVVFATPRVQGWAFTMVARLVRERDGSTVRVMDHRLRVATDPRSGWGALNFLELNSALRSWIAWDTCNPHPDANAPILPFGRHGLVFPQNASVPLQIVHKAAAEYSYTAARPKEILWQRSNHF